MAFILSILILVFVHELGHYLLARRAGVHVEVFSIGFGPELLGWNDRLGTRWRIAIIPLGGYVRMTGGEDISDDELAELSKEEREKSYITKTVGQRSLILAAGPFFNFVFAIVALAGLYFSHGKN